MAYPNMRFRSSRRHELRDEGMVTDNLECQRNLFGGLTRSTQKLIVVQGGLAAGFSYHVPSNSMVGACINDPNTLGVSRGAIALQLVDVLSALGAIPSSRTACFSVSESLAWQVVGEATAPFGI